MTYYSPTSSTLVSGTAWTNVANAYDGNTATVASKYSISSTAQATSWNFSADVSGMSALTIDIAWSATCNDAWNDDIGEYLTTSVDLYYTFDTVWTYLDSFSSNGDGIEVSGGPGTSYQSYTISGLSGKNLNTLKVRATVRGRARPGALPSTVGPAYGYVYEIRANATSGPSVGTISRTGTLQAGLAQSLSCTTSGESTGVTWSQYSPASPSGSFSGTTYTNPNAATTWTAPSGTPGCTGITYVIRCTAQTSPNPYSAISIAIPLITISTPTYGGGTVLTGQTLTISSNIGNDQDAAISWSATGGTFGGGNFSGGVLTKSWTAPDTAGNYTITLTSNKDQNVTNQVVITVVNAFTPVKELTPIPTTGTARQLFHNGFNYTTGNLDAPTTGVARTYELSAANPATTTAKPFFFKGTSIPAVVRSRVWPSGYTGTSGSVDSPANAYTATDQAAVASGTQITTSHLANFLASDIVAVSAVDSGYGDYTTQGAITYTMTAGVSATYTLKAILQGNSGYGLYDPGYSSCYDCNGYATFLTEQEIFGSVAVDYWIGSGSPVSIGTFTGGNDFAKQLISQAVTLTAGQVVSLRFRCLSSAFSWENPCGCEADELRVVAIPYVNIYMCCME